MKDTVIARKYAEALFRSATAKNQVRACQQGLEEITRVVRAKESIRRILIQPFISPAEKQKLVHSALGEYATPLFERFLNMLVEKRRFELLPVIADQFQEAVDQAQNVAAVQVRAAMPMSETQRKSLQSRLETWLHSKVRMTVAVDADLIGGVVIRLGDRELDHSIKRQLKSLQETLSR